MADVSIKHGNTEFASLSATGTKTLKTGEKYVSEDIVVEYTKPEAPAPALTTLNATANGTYRPEEILSMLGYDGWDEVVVDVPQPAYSGYVINRRGNNNGINGLVGSSWVETWNMTSTGNRDFWNTAYNSPARIYYRNGIKTITEHSATNCANLTYIYLGKSLTSINEAAFGKGGQGMYTAGYSAPITTVEIENGFNTRLPLGGCPSLSLTSVRGIIENYKANSGKTLVLYYTVFNQLEETDFTAATNKGLTITSFTP